MPKQILEGDIIVLKKTRRTPEEMVVIRNRRKENNRKHARNSREIVRKRLQELEEIETKYLLYFNGNIMQTADEDNLCLYGKIDYMRAEIVKLQRILEERKKEIEDLKEIISHLSCELSKTFLVPVSCEIVLHDNGVPGTVANK